MVVSAAVVPAPTATPVFREIAYARSPYCRVPGGLKRVHTWRFQTPFRYGQLSQVNKEKADALRGMHGLRFNPVKSERDICFQQFEVYEKMKNEWDAHSQESGKQIVVYYQEEVRQLMETLGIPALHLRDLFEDEESAHYDPQQDSRPFPNLEGTCQLPHDKLRPCQGTLVKRLSHFTWSKPIKRQSHSKEETKLVEGKTKGKASWELLMDKEEAGEDENQEGDVSEVGNAERVSWADLMDEEDAKEEDDDIIVKVLPCKK